jgi:hypothetical protein
MKIPEKINLCFMLTAAGCILRFAHKNIRREKLGKLERLEKEKEKPETEKAEAKRKAKADDFYARRS